LSTFATRPLRSRPRGQPAFGARRVVLHRQTARYARWLRRTTFAKRSPTRPANRSRERSERLAKVGPPSPNRSLRSLATEDNLRETLAYAACQPKPRAKRALGEGWRRGWDSNPRAGHPTRRFRGAPVTTTSVPLRSNVRLYTARDEGVTRRNPLLVARHGPAAARAATVAAHSRGASRATSIRIRIRHPRTCVRGPLAGYSMVTVAAGSRCARCARAVPPQPPTTPRRRLADVFRYPCLPVR
jgi:hypothetical protein